MSKTLINVLVDLDQFEEAAEGVEGAGVEIVQRNPDVGTISGRVDSNRVAAIERVRGVIAVEGEREFSIAPPDSDLQ